jgi:hypothetical protein
MDLHFSMRNVTTRLTTLLKTPRTTFSYLSPAKDRYTTSGSSNHDPTKKSIFQELQFLKVTEEALKNIMGEIKNAAYPSSNIFLDAITHNLIRVRSEVNSITSHP